MIKEIEAKSILQKVTQPDDWFGLTYNMNLYRGCQHQCIYCDSRSDCYQIENFADIEIKVNAIQLLRKELASKKKKGTVGFGSMNDPYMPVERDYRLTREALIAINEFKFPIHIITKSDNVLDDLEHIKQASKIYSAVSFSISTSADDQAKIVEPGAPVTSNRFAALKILTDNGILAGITLMPLLPFIQDTPENVLGIVEKAKEAGAKYIIPGFGMTLRDGQREYYYKKLDQHYPGIKLKYKRIFKNKYGVGITNYAEIDNKFKEMCSDYKIPLVMPKYQQVDAAQLSMF